MSDSDDRTKRVARLDWRVLAGFAAGSVVLIAPAIVNALTPADEQALNDAASSLGIAGRQALAIVDARARLTPVMYEVELQDIAARAADTRQQLERQSIGPGLDVERTELVAAAAELSAAVDAASLVVDDTRSRTSDRDRIAAAVARLAGMGSGG